MSPFPPRRPRLLVSVRSAGEAAAALAGGADLIDVKEPARGPLGRPDPATLAAILGAVAGRAPVSAALGEWLRPPAEGWEEFLLPGVAYLKWGLAGCRGHADFPARWLEARARVEASSSARVVAAAYADWRRAAAPEPERVADLACGHGFAAFLLDTWGKDGSTLLDWADVGRLRVLCDRLREAGVLIALAGSLGAGQIRQLGEVGPDIFAVRGAACRGGERGREMDAARVRELAHLLSSPGGDQQEK